MHDEQWHNLEETIDKLSEREKLELIERMARSLRQPNGHKSTRTPEQVAGRLQQIASLPLRSPDDGFSGVDHDAVLYGAPLRAHPGGSPKS